MLILRNTILDVNKIIYIFSIFGNIFPDIFLLKFKVKYNQEFSIFLGLLLKWQTNAIKKNKASRENEIKMYNVLYFFYTI